MKRFQLPVLILLLAACGRPKTDVNITIGKIDSLHSRILGEERKIWVYVPDNGGDAKKRFTVVYLLDADWNFQAFAGMVHQLSEVLNNRVVPQMIVVGIVNTDRTRDLTPTNSLYYPGTKPDSSFKVSGGGEKFMAFMQKELLPYVDSAYSTAPYKILIGHSFGGLTAINALLHHTALFNAYVSIDPSMWWDHRKLLNECEQGLAEKRFSGKSLYLAIANTMPPGMDTLQVRLDTSGKTDHIRSILKLKDILQHNGMNGLNWNYRYYKDDDHPSVPPIAEYDALRFLYSYYKYPIDPYGGIAHVNADPLTDVTRHFKMVSGHMGYKVLPPEEMVNNLGYHYLEAKSPDKAYSLFALNLQNYPQSANAYDSMGDYYASKNDKAKAIEYYKKALSIKELPETKMKLNSLQKKK